MEAVTATMLPSVGTLISPMVFYGSMAMETMQTLVLLQASGLRMEFACAGQPEVAVELS